MNCLDNALESMLEKEFTSNKIVSKLIAKKLAELGVTLRDDQLESLERDIDWDNLDKIILDLDDEQERQLRSTETGPEGNVIISLTDQDVADFGNSLQSTIEALMPRAISTASKALLEAWKSDAPRLLAERTEERSGFEKRLYETWSSAIGLLEVLICISLEAGSEFNQQFRPEAARKGDAVFEVLTRSHARACQVAFEILTLLKAGFADGALARWRTLHEIAVTAMFVAAHDNQLAERFLDHAAITNYREAKEYQNHCHARVYDPLSDEEWSALEARKAELLHRYGKGFASDYGWASEVLGEGRPTFKDIEKNVELEHLRPFYKLANINVHAGSKGLSFRLGLPEGHDDVLVAGPSSYGLADPGQNTAISMNQIITTLLLTKPNLDRLAFLSATQVLVSQIMDGFIKVHHGLEKDTAGGSEGDSHLPA